MNQEIEDLERTIRTFSAKVSTESKVVKWCGIYEMQTFQSVRLATGRCLGTSNPKFCWNTKRPSLDFTDTSAVSCKCWYFLWCLVSHSFSIIRVYLHLQNYIIGLLRCSSISSSRFIFISASSPIFCFNTEGKETRSLSDLNQALLQNFAKKPKQKPNRDKHQQ